MKIGTKIVQNSEETEPARKKYIKNIDPLNDILKNWFKFKIFGRPKSIYSIYNKIKTKGVPFEENYDLFAIHCYRYSYG